jgi:hypothetical protein
MATKSPVRHVLTTAVATATLLLTAAGCAQPTGGGTAAQEVPAPGTPTEASCPQTLDSAHWPGQQTRSGPFLPAHPVTALLCAYPLTTASDGVATLTGQPYTAGDPVAVAAYLNGLPDRTPPADEVCLAAAATGYVLVFGYADRPAAVVHLACGAEQSGAVRFSYDLRQIFAFWGLPKTGVPG